MRKRFFVKGFSFLQLSIEKQVYVFHQWVDGDNTWVVSSEGLAILVDQKLLKIPVDVSHSQRRVEERGRVRGVRVLAATLDRVSEGWMRSGKYVENMGKNI